MLLSTLEIRRVRCSAICALLAAYVWIPAASAQQASTGDVAKKSPTQSGSATKSSSPSSAKKSTGTTHSSAHHSSRTRRSARSRGQKKIDPERARTIQEALIREHYLSGEPTGEWNQASEDAMRRYQGDHGWQTKEVPDSRALISLGLGPSKDHLLNPESAMTTGPQAPAATSPAPATPSTAPATPAASPSQGDPSHLQ
jgi:Ni/Co efflux regulator RcnB